MKKDIKTTKDIQLLVNTFYEKVRADNTIGYMFNDIVKVNWERHLPVMYNFWENALFYTGTYEGSPMELYKYLPHLAPLTVAHFKQWTLLFDNTVDELFYGTKSELAKQRAQSIATIMQIKIFSEQSSKDTIF